MRSEGILLQSGKTESMKWNRFSTIEHAAALGLWLHHSQGNRKLLPQISKTRIRTGFNHSGITLQFYVVLTSQFSSLAVSWRRRKVFNFKLFYYLTFISQSQQLNGTEHWIRKTKSYLNRETWARLEGHHISTGSTRNLLRIPAHPYPNICTWSKTQKFKQKLQQLFTNLWLLHVC